jgi:hypothetical protein
VIHSKNAPSTNFDTFFLSAEAKHIMCMIFGSPAIAQIMELAAFEDIHIEAPSTSLTPASADLVVRKTTLSGIFVDVRLWEHCSMGVKTVVQSCKYGKFII